MISAKFFYTGDICSGCTISGHASYASHGKDIVCAYVSASVQLTANLMTEIFCLPVDIQEREENATVSICVTKPDDTGNADRLLRGLEMQLKSLSEVYPRNIHFAHQEV